MKILFTCGGTAGHINPAVALARWFQSRDPQCQVLFVGADGGMETRLVPKEGYEVKTVAVSHLVHSISLQALVKNVQAVCKLWGAGRSAGKILDQFQPDLVVGTGGYASYPVVKEAARRGIPTAIHESNAVPGVTTKALSKVVDLVMVGFEEAVAHYEHKEKVKVTGTPVRPDFFRYTRQEARQALGLEDDAPLVLSFWGSLGAENMNDKMLDFLEIYAREQSTFHHIHGAGRDFDIMNAALRQRGVELKEDRAEIRQYIYDMPTVMAAADLVLCRSGASTLSELTAIAKPAVLVPSPNVTANHQYKNARVLSDRGGAILMEEKDCTARRLYDTVTSLLEDPVLRGKMEDSLRAMGQGDATERIGQALLELIKNK